MAGINPYDLGKTWLVLFALSFDDDADVFYAAKAR